MIDALFSSTQQRVLAVLFGDPAKRFLATEVIRLVDAGSGATQRELQRLAEGGLLTRTRDGNRVVYQANRKAPIFDEVHGIIRKTIGLADPVRESLASVAKGISFAAIFGSVASAADTAASDVDLLVVADTLQLTDLYAALQPAEHRLRRRITPTLYSTTEFLKRRDSGAPFLRKVLERPLIPIIGEPPR